jgi:hypothetical protein
MTPESLHQGPSLKIASNGRPYHARDDDFPAGHFPLWVNGGGRELEQDLQPSALKATFREAAARLLGWKSACGMPVQ